MLQEKKRMLAAASEKIPDIFSFLFILAQKEIFANCFRLPEKVKKYFLFFLTGTEAAVYIPKETKSFQYRGLENLCSDTKHPNNYQEEKKMNDMNEMMNNGFGDLQADATYDVDITMIMDATGSMSPIINQVKDNALSFCDKFHRAMDGGDKNVDKLRIRVIAYRDFGYTNCPALECSEFFTLPEQNEAFRSWVNGITAKGGGDEPESALEALATAMRSDWTTGGTKRRHVILVFTDASAVQLNDPSRTCHPNYPENMPKSMAELSEMWAGTSQTLGGMPNERWARLVAFAPNSFPWNELPSWNNVWNCFSRAGEGLSEFDIDAAIQILVASIN